MRQLLLVFKIRSFMLTVLKCFSRLKQNIFSYRGG